jgi:hypothetical protein
MTNEEVWKLFDNILRETIEKELESLQRDNAGQGFAEKVIKEAIQRKKLPVSIESDDEYVEMSYVDLEREVKRILREEYGDQLDREIAELRKKLGYDRGST